MPLVANEEYDLAVRIGEALNDELQGANDCWEPRLVPFKGAELLLTINGQDFLLKIQRKAALPHE